ncbi:hypothetical protein Landi51_05967 [Colletotrichum acutatum]
MDYTASKTVPGKNPPPYTLTSFEAGALDSSRSFIDIPSYCGRWDHIELPGSGNRPRLSLACSLDQESRAGPAYARTRPVGVHCLPNALKQINKTSPKDKKQAFDTSRASIICRIPDIRVTQLNISNVSGQTLQSPAASKTLSCLPSLPDSAQRSATHIGTLHSVTLYQKGARDGDLPTTGASRRFSTAMRGFRRNSRAEVGGMSKAKELRCHGQDFFFPSLVFLSTVPLLSTPKSNFSEPHARPFTLPSRSPAEPLGNARRGTAFAVADQWAETAVVPTSPESHV